MDKKVSVIVPVYNVSAYLDECIQSILSQTYTNLEIILVDDGSTDESGAICDKYTADERVKVIHQQNGGAGKAKNTALDVFSGDYVVFLDGDDCFDENFVKIMVTTLEEKDADIVQCALYKFLKTKSWDLDNAKVGEYTPQEFLGEFLQHWTPALFANKIFKKELLQDVRFYEGRVIDDEFFTYKAVIKASKIIVIPDGLYRYRMRKTGVTNLGRWRQRLLDRIAYFTERYAIVSKAFPSLKQAYLRNLADNLMSIKLDTHEFPDLTKEANKCMRRYFWQVLASKMHWKVKVGYCKVLFTKPKGAERKPHGEIWNDFFD